MKGWYRSGYLSLYRLPARWNGTRVSSSLPDDTWQDTLRCFEVGHDFSCLDFSLDEEFELALMMMLMLMGLQNFIHHTLSQSTLIVRAGHRHVGEREGQGNQKGDNAPRGEGWKVKATRFMI